MPQTQNIPRTQLTGSQQFTFASSTQPWTDARVVIDRTVVGGLNSAATTLVLSIDVDYSPDGGTTWVPVGGLGGTPGGTIITKGFTLTQDSIAIGIGVQFPTGTVFRIDTNVNSGSVFVGGGTSQVIYE